MERGADLGLALVTAGLRIGVRVCDEIFRNCFAAASFHKRMKLWNSKIGGLFKVKFNRKKCANLNLT